LQEATDQKDEVWFQNQDVELIEEQVALEVSVQYLAGSLFSIFESSALDAT
jgi:hypothetical protein